MKTSLYALTLLASLSLFGLGCRPAFDLATLTPSTTEKLGLPPLQAEVSPQGFAFSPVMEDDARDEGYYVAAQPVVQDQRFFDAQALFRKEVHQVWSKGTSPTYGWAVFHLSAANELNRGWSYSCLSLSTFGLLNLLGFPTANYLNQVEIEVEIFDRNNQLLGRYYGRGEAQSLTGLYYGRRNDRDRFVQVMQAALAEVRKQVATDAPTLRQQLERAGAIYPGQKP